MFVNDYSIALAFALIPCVIAGFAFSPVFGIKFKSHQVELVLLYSFLSTLMAVATMIIAFIVLVSLTVSQVSSPTGADTSTLIVTAIIGLVVLIVLTRFNASLLTIFAFRFPNCFELPSQKRSITLAAATVALLQVALCIAPSVFNFCFFRETIPAALQLDDKPTELNSLPADEAKQEKSSIENQEKLAKLAKELPQHAAMCVKSWSDVEAWKQTSVNAPAWLNIAENLIATSNRDDKLISYQAAILTIYGPGTLNEAEEAARRALAINQLNALAHGVLGHCLSSKHENEKAITEFSQAINIEKKNLEWYANRGLCYEENKNNDKAIADYSTIISMAPQSAWAYGSRAHAYLAQDKVAEAMSDAKKALSIEPNNDFSAKQLADAQTHLGHFDEALSLLATVEKRTNKDSAEIIELLGMQATILEFKGQKAEAHKLRNKAAEMCKRFNK